MKAREAVGRITDINQERKVFPQEIPVAALNLLGLISNPNGRKYLNENSNESFELLKMQLNQLIDNITKGDDHLEYLVRMSVFAGEQILLKERKEMNQL